MVATVRSNGRREGNTSTLGGFSGGSVVKEFACQHRRPRRCGFDPWVRKITWRRKWQPDPVFLPGKSHGQRSLVGYSPWGRKEVDMTEHPPHTHTHTHAHNLKESPPAILVSSFSQSQWRTQTVSHRVPLPSLVYNMSILTILSTYVWNHIRHVDMIFDSTISII